MKLTQRCLEELGQTTEPDRYLGIAPSWQVEVKWKAGKLRNSRSGSLTPLRISEVPSHAINICDKDRAPWRGTAVSCVRFAPILSHHEVDWRWEHILAVSRLNLKVENNLVAFCEAV